MTHAGQDTSDERDKEQEVDRSEPRRPVHIEESEPVEQWTEGGLLVDPLVDEERVVASLRKDRTRDTRDSQSEEQNQCDPHAGELAPRPPQETLGVQRRCNGFDAGIAHRAVSNPGIVTRSQIVKSSHSPVTSSSPTSTSIPPPMRIIHV